MNSELLRNTTDIENDDKALLSVDELHAILNSSPVGIVKVNNKGEFLFANKAFCEIMEYTKKELKLMTFKDITAKDDLSNSKRYFKKICEGDIKEHVFQKKYISKTGKTIHAQTTLKGFYEDGELKIITAHIIDQTKQTKVFKKYEDLNASLNNSACIIFTDLKGSILEVNEPTVENSGYSRKELINNNMSIFNSNLHSKAFFKNMWDTINAGQFWQGEVRNKMKNGKYCWCFETITPILNLKGKIHQFISVMFDITESKIFNNALTREVIEVQEHERERFAMDIHDGLGQTLLAAKMNLSAVNYSKDNLDDDSKKAIINTLNLLREATQEARNISHNLMGKALSQNGLIYALNNIIRNINFNRKIDFILT